MLAHRSTSGSILNINVPSTVIAQMEYDKTKKILRIIFVSGKIYEYLEVPENIFLEMRSASSKGIFFNKQVKPYYAFKENKKIK